MDHIIILIAALAVGYAARKAYEKWRDRDA